MHVGAVNDVVLVKIEISESRGQSDGFEWVDCASTDCNNLVIILTSYAPVSVTITSGATKSILKS